MRRVVTAELLDRDIGTPREIVDSLSDLRRVNRWFGGVNTTLAMLQRVAFVIRLGKLSMLDVGAGSGDIALAAQRAMARERIRLDVTLTDRSLTHLKTAAPEDSHPWERRQSVRNDIYENGWPLRRIVADALALPFSDSSFDIVSCALLAHHLDPDQFRRFVAEALRVCRVAVLINDLRRSLLSLGLVYAGFPLFRSPLSRQDGPASVRRAYTIPEIRAMLPQNGLCRVEISSHYLFRMGAIIWKKS